MVAARDTPSRLIEAAEELFIAGGEAATSLRAIARVAHANAAAVHYHFGGRDELLRAVLDRYLVPLRERRRRDVDATVEAAGGLAPIEDIVEGALRADVELLSRLRHGKAPLARLLGEVTLRRGRAGVEVDWCGVEYLTYLATLLRPRLPELRSGELAERLRLTYAGVCVLFLTAPQPGEPGLTEGDSAREQLRRLTAVTLGALAAAPAGGARRKPATAKAERTAAKAERTAAKAERTAAKAVKVKRSKKSGAAP